MMSLFARIIERVKAIARRYGRATWTAPTCVVCRHGAGPVLGVPIYNLDGHHRHLMCMTIGRQIGAGAVIAAMRSAQDSLAAMRSTAPAPQPAVPRQVAPAVITYRAELSGNWN